MSFDVATSLVSGIKASYSTSEKKISGEYLKDIYTEIEPLTQGLIGENDECVSNGIGSVKMPLRNGVLVLYDNYRGSSSSNFSLIFRSDSGKCSYHDGEIDGFFDDKLGGRYFIKGELSLKNLTDSKNGRVTISYYESKDVCIMYEDFPTEESLVANRSLAFARVIEESENLQELFNHLVCSGDLACLMYMKKYQKSYKGYTYVKGRMKVLNSK